MGNNTINSRNPTVDFFKLFFLAVVILHHSGLLSGIMHHGYISVDFFFIVSGYFLYHTCQKYRLNQFIGRRLKQLYPHYILAFLLAFCILGGVSLLQSIPEILMMQNIGITRYGGLNYPMWYISVLFYGSILLWMILNSVPEKILSPVLLLIGSIGIILIVDNNAIELWDCCGGWIYPPLFRGLSGMCCGILVSRHKSRLHVGKPCVTIIFVLLVAEIFGRTFHSLLCLPLYIYFPSLFYVITAIQFLTAHQ